MGLCTCNYERGSAHIHAHSCEVFHRKSRTRNGTICNWLSSGKNNNRCLDWLIDGIVSLQQSVDFSTVQLAKLFTWDLLFQAEQSLSPLENVMVSFFTQRVFSLSLSVKDAASRETFWYCRYKVSFKIEPNTMIANLRSHTERRGKSSLKQYPHDFAEEKQEIYLATCSFSMMIVQGVAQHALRCGPHWDRCW